MSPPAGSPPPGSPTPGRARAGTASSIASSVRSATEKILDKDLPPGFVAATAEATSKAPTVGDIRNSGGHTRSDSAEGHRRSRSHSQSRRAGRLSRGSKDFDNRREGPEPFPALSEEDYASREEALLEEPALTQDGVSTAWNTKETDNLNSPETNSTSTGQYANGYVPPPKLPWTTSTAIALKAFWKFFLTPFGFLVTIYGLNIVAWGGMLFLLLIGGAPAMCWANDPEQGWVYDCDHIDSARRIWVEVTSQILNALFCVTGFGLIPWRFRDLYFILSYRFTSEKKHGRAKKMQGLRKLGGHYRTWFRLPGSDTLNRMSAKEYAQTYANAGSISTELESGDITDLRTTIPSSKQPDEPPTGIWAPATKVWKMDFFVWCQVWNTFFQVCLSGFMWGMNRYDRPAWSTGLFVALACGIVGVGGLVSYFEGKRVKKVEGIPPRPET